MFSTPELNTGTQVTQNSKIHALTISTTPKSTPQRLDQPAAPSPSPIKSLRQFCTQVKKYKKYSSLTFTENNIYEAYASVLWKKEVNSRKAECFLKEFKEIGLLGVCQAAGKKRRSFTKDQFLENPATQAIIRSATKTSLDFKTLQDTKKEYLKKSITAMQELFVPEAEKICILFLAGKAKNDSIILDEKFEIGLSLQRILDVWGKMTARLEEGAPKMQLLLVICASSAEVWVEAVRRRGAGELISNVSIVGWQGTAESESFQDQSNDFLGYFLKMNWPGCPPEISLGSAKFKPVFYSPFFADFEKYFGLKFNSEIQTEFQNEETKKSLRFDDNFLPINEATSPRSPGPVQLNGKGSKKFKNGRLETGVFVEDRLEGPGIIDWKGVQVRGIFRQGVLMEKHQIQFSDGETVYYYPNGSETAPTDKKLKIWDGFFEETTQLKTPSGFSNVFKRTRKLFENSDEMLCCSRDDSHHGLRFYFHGDGGLEMSKWEEGREVFSYGIDAHGQITLRVQNPYFGKIQESTDGRPANDQNSEDLEMIDDDMLMYSGTVRSFFREFWNLDWSKFVAEANTIRCGKMVFQNSNRNGTWVPDGVSGRLDFGNGSYYEGHWKQGLPDGKGIFAMPNCYQYHGSWRNGLRHGYGRMSYLDGTTYTGDWRMDHIFGNGKLELPDRVIEGVMFKPEILNPLTPLKRENELSALDFLAPEAVSGIVSIKGPKPGDVFTIDTNNTAPLDNISSYYGEFFQGECFGVGELKIGHKISIFGQFIRNRIWIRKFVSPDRPLSWKNGTEYYGDCLAVFKTSNNSSRFFENDDKFWQFETPHGEGVLALLKTKTENKEKIAEWKYSGMFSEGAQHGPGKLEINDIGVLEGKFSQNKFVSGAKFTISGVNFAKNVVFTGNFELKNLKIYHRKNVENLKIAKDCVYAGEALFEIVEKSKFQTAKNSEEFLKFAYLDGPGKIKFPDEKIFSGKFVKNQISGIGKIQFSGGGQVEGNFQSEKSDDLLSRGLSQLTVSTEAGSIVFWDGSEYQGKALFGLLTEDGLWAMPDLENFRNLLAFEGQGKLTSPGGETFDGSFRRDGSFVGTYSFKDGSNYHVRLTRYGLYVSNVTIKLAEELAYVGQARYVRSHPDSSPSDRDLNEHWSFDSLAGHGVAAHAKKGLFSGKFEKGLPTKNCTWTSTIGMRKKSAQIRYVKPGVIEIGSGKIAISNLTTYEGDFAHQLVQPLQASEKGGEFWATETAPHGKGAFFRNSEKMEFLMFEKSICGQAQNLILQNGGFYTGGCLKRLSENSGPDPSFQFVAKHGRGVETYQNGAYTIEGEWESGTPLRLVVTSSSLSSRWTLTYRSAALVQLSLTNVGPIESLEIDLESLAAGGAALFQNQLLVQIRFVAARPYFISKKANECEFWLNCENYVVEFLEKIWETAMRDPLAIGKAANCHTAIFLYESPSSIESWYPSSSELNSFDSEQPTPGSSTPARRSRFTHPPLPSQSWTKADVFSFHKKGNLADFRQAGQPNIPSQSQISKKSQKMGNGVQTPVSVVNGDLPHYTWDPSWDQSVMEVPEIELTPDHSPNQSVCLDGARERVSSNDGKVDNLKTREGVGKGEPCQVQVRTPGPLRDREAEGVERRAGEVQTGLSKKTSKDGEMHRLKG